MAKKTSGNIDSGEPCKRTAPIPLVLEYNEENNKTEDLSLQGDENYIMNQEGTSLPTYFINILASSEEKTHL